VRTIQIKEICINIYYSWIVCFVIQLPFDKSIYSIALENSKRCPYGMESPRLASKDVHVRAYKYFINNGVNAHFNLYHIMLDVNHETLLLLLLLLLRLLQHSIVK
jgi:hypothetical protein